MKKLIYLIGTICLSAWSSLAFSQSIPFPPEPPYNTLAPWGYTQVGTNWDTSPYLPFKYQGIWFRLMPPNGVTFNRNQGTYGTWTFSEPGKLYPLMVFSTGAGERGSDNNAQLKHGGQHHRDAVLSGRFPGFTLWWQTENGYLDSDKIQGIINKLIQDLPIDINRVYCEGFSRGGTVTWQFVRDLPRTFAATFPMSAASPNFYNASMVHIPARLTQGGLDTNPEPNDAYAMVNSYAQTGGSLEFFFLPTTGHGTWNWAYNLSDFYEWFLKQKKNQIHVFFGKTEVCPGDPVNIKLGMTAGFDGYEWRRNGVTIGGATQNDYTATQFGIYEARFRRGSVWTDWSEPVELKEKAPTQTPPIAPVAGKSVYLPSPDGSTSVTLELPTGYEEYTWKNATSGAILGTNRTLNVTTPGTFIASVKEFGGCSSLDSPPYAVVNANGPNAPDAISNLSITPQGLVSLVLDWDDNPTPANDETGFEIYRSENEAGPYQLIKINPANNTTYTDPGLISGRRYYYIIRSINATAASAASSPVSSVTGLDEIKPTAPVNLTVTASTPTSVTIRWNASSDNVGVIAYDIYVNGLKAYTSTTLTSQVTFQVNELLTNQLYNFVVRARDAAGNSSEASNQVTRATIGAGVNYEYFHHTAEDNWMVLPDFSTLTPIKLGWLSNFSLSPRTQNDYFAFRFTGKLNVTVASTYTFYLSSDDGSRLFIDGQLRVNHDGLHGNSEMAGEPFFLSAGVHDIVVEHFEKTGGEALTVRWSRPGLNKQNIPNSALTDVFTYPATPSTPSWPSSGHVVAASYDAMNVTWMAGTYNATTIEIFRSLNNSSWVKIKEVPVSQNTFTDTGLNPNTRYYYRLRAIGPNGESGYSVSRNTFTQQLPPVPAAPAALAGIPQTNSVSLTWTDNSSNETSFEVERSIGTTNEFEMVASLPAGSTSHVDAGLFAHTDYVYRVRARNVTGASGYSNLLNVTTLNSNPVIEPLTAFQMRYDEVKVLQIAASDPDGDDVIISVENLPDFAYMYDYGDGTGEIFFEPTIDDQQVYTNIEVTVIDAFGGISSGSFNFEVNENHSPTIDSVQNVYVKETYVANVIVSATDLDGDPVTWELTNVPDFVSHTVVGNTVEFVIAPDEQDAGNYQIGLKALDTQGSSSTGSLMVSVEEFNPHFKVLVNFGGTGSGPAPWNNFIRGTPTVGDLISNLLTDTGNETPISITSLTTWNNSGSESNQSYTIDGIFYPNTVSNTYFNTTGGSTEAEILNIEGLNPNNKYNLSFLASRVDGSRARDVIFEVGAQQIQIDAIGNTTQIAKFLGLVPDANGVITVRVFVPLPGNSRSGPLNAMVIESFYDGNTPPETPTNFAVANTDGILLTWNDNSNIESGFEVFRSDDGINFIKQATLPANTTSYIDDSFMPLYTYYYTLRAVNSNGNSAFTDTLSIDALNRAPYIEPIDEITVSQGSTKTVLIQADDAEGGFLSFWLENAPSFAMLEYVDYQSVNLVLSPQEGDADNYTFNLVVMDGYGDMAQEEISVVVSSTIETYVHINFTRTTNVAGAPWNNFMVAGTASVPVGAGLSNVLDAQGTPTTIDFTFSDTWDGVNLSGVTSGVYETNVVRSALWDNTSNRDITFSGLNPDNSYDFTIFASRSENGGATINRTTVYSAGGKSSSLNASNNATGVASLLGLKPNASGEIVLNASLAAGSSYIYLGSVIIREYVSDGTPVAPTNLITSTLSRNAIKLDWSDQSDNEQGFEIWQSVGDNSNYQLIHTTGPDVETYTNTGLTQSTTYYYQVRAKVSDESFSDYSNESTAKTFISSVSINFGAVDPAPAPWNNLFNFLGTAGDRVNALTNDLGVATNMNLVIVDPFIDDNSNGMNTGNNSGIVPDAVMETAYWLDPGDAFATLRIEGLSSLYAYNFGFFGSRNGGGNRNTNYTINGTTVTLNASYNISEIVQIKNVVPDGNGFVTIRIQAAPGASFGYLNGLVIQVVSPDAPANGREGTVSQNNTQEQELRENPIVSEASVIAYPNPFEDRIVIQSAYPAELVNISLLSTAGSTLQVQVPVSDGSGNYEIDFSSSSLKSGFYFLRLGYKDGASKTLKIIRK